MSEPIKYEYDNYDRKVIILFKEGPKIEDEKSFSRTHYFSDEEMTIITTDFKDELLKLFNVSNVEMLKETIDDNVGLVFKPGEGTIEYNEKSSTVIIYTKTFKEDIVLPKQKIAKLKKSVQKLSSGEKVTSSEYTNLLETISNNVQEIELSAKDLNRIKKLIPKLIRNGKIKISLKDITDINKDRLKDIVQLGRDILNKKQGVEKKLGIEREHIGKEYAWQKFFELYGSYILFGSVEETIPQKVIDANSQIRNGISELDLLTINRYGFIDIVELKRSDEYMFKIDNSHDNFVPTDKLNTAIAQVNNYLMILPFAKDGGELVKGAESATGLLVMGADKYLVKEEILKKYIEKTNVPIATARLKVRKALRDLNYAYAHIQIILYDELLDNLDRFIDQMKIEVDD